MNNGPGEQLQLSELNDHDVMKPHMTRSYWDDRAGHYEGRDRFMAANPELVEALEKVADELIFLQDGDCEPVQAEFELPAAVSPYGGGHTIMILNSESPHYAIRLALDHDVKAQTAYEYFVHSLDPIFYEEPAGESEAGEFSHNLLLGLVERTDQREPEEFDPPFALAISNDCRLARIVPKASEEVVASRREERVVNTLASSSRSVGARQAQAILEELRLDSIREVGHGLRDPRLSRVGDLAVRELLGAEGMVSLTAVESEEMLLGFDSDGRVELMVEDKRGIPLELLLAARSVLSRPEAFDTVHSESK